MVGIHLPGLDSISNKDGIAARDSLPKSMSLPGLGLSTQQEEEVVLPAYHVLKEGSEWRFEVSFDSRIEVKLLSGDAELFGTELAQQQPYEFSGVKAAIYSWHGCRLEVTGECQFEYIAEETPMTMYTNLHFALERLRDQALIAGKEGPRVLVLGPDNAGKTSLVKLLTAHATRSGRQPVTVNLDPKEGMLTMPGTLSTAVFSSIVDVEEGWGSSPTNGPTTVPVKLPLVYYYGLASPEEKTVLFKPLVQRLALSVMSRFNEDADARATGCIIDTPGVISQGKVGYEVIQHIVAEFSVNVVIIMGSERLYSDMSRRFNGQKLGDSETTTVLKLDKSGGCVDRDAEFLERSRLEQVREYFMGDARNPLSPHTQQIDASQLTIYRVAESSALLSSLLPGGEDENATPPLFEKVTVSPQLQSAVLAIVKAEPNDTQDSIRDASVIGFVYVAEVDETKNKLRILSPASGRLPHKALIWGSWPEAGELSM